MRNDQRSGNITQGAAPRQVPEDLSVTVRWSMWALAAVLAVTVVVALAVRGVGGGAHAPVHAPRSPAIDNILGGGY